MTQRAHEYSRYCPGEESVRISDAVCLGRRRAHFSKCPGCQFNDDENFAAAARPMDPVHPETRKIMIEKVFKAYDVRATAPDPLNEDVAWRIGNATAQFLRATLSGYDRSDPDKNTLIVGRDMRRSSPSLCAAFIEGALASGASVIDIGMVDTPQVSFAVNHLPSCGGVQTTASHNPANYNGFKICGQRAKPIGAETGLKEIERIAVAIARHKSFDRDQIRQIDLAQPYREHLRKFLKRPRRLKVVVDASNGMAGRWFPVVLGDIPELDVIPLNFETNGDFVHPPNPLVAANLEQLRAAVRTHGADFGACFDGDADRCIFVDEKAEIIRCDILTALLAGEYLRDHPGSTIVYDLRSSRMVKTQIERHGGTPRRERVGHVFMKRTMAENDAVFGGELSGHFYFRDFFYCDSGLLAFIAVLNAMTADPRPLSERIAPLNVLASSGEINFENPDKQATLNELAARYADAQIDHLDGVTVQYEDWWFNVRPSNTEPLLRLNLEANDPQLLQEKLNELTPMLGAPVAH